MGTKLSPNMEMYLKTILRLGRDGQTVRVKAIADALGITMPSVSGALRQLKAKGLVLHSAYGAVRLSARGRRAAGQVDERYEILRKFFTDVLDLDPRTADRDACEIEHVLGNETLERLTAFLDYTTRCRLDVKQVIEHFHEYLKWRLAGDYCQDCEAEGGPSQDCPMPAKLQV
jgi:DtxR family Mn-dependent transcriptional regulator